MMGNALFVAFVATLRETNPVVFTWDHEDPHIQLPAPFFLQPSRCNSDFCRSGFDDSHREAASRTRLGRVQQVRLAGPKRPAQNRTYKDRNMEPTCSRCDL